MFMFQRLFPPTNGTAYGDSQVLFVCTSDFMFYNPSLGWVSDPLRVGYPDTPDAISHDQTVFVKGKIKVVEILFTVPGAVGVERVERVITYNMFLRFTPQVFRAFHSELRPAFALDEVTGPLAPIQDY